MGRTHVLRLPPGPRKSSQDLSPLSASGFFTQALEVQPPNTDTTFRVYLNSPTVAAPQPFPSIGRPDTAQGSQNGTGKGTYLVCHHGAGASGLSFAALAREVSQRSGGEMGVLSYDARGHGGFAGLIYRY
jgi:protein phosphatase methylesterase 1